MFQFVGNVSTVYLLDERKFDCLLFVYLHLGTSISIISDISKHIFVFSYFVFLYFCIFVFCIFVFLYFYLQLSSYPPQPQASYNNNPAPSYTQPPRRADQILYGLDSYGKPVYMDAADVAELLGTPKAKKVKD